MFNTCFNLPRKNIKFYRVVKCDVIKNLILEFLNFFFIFRKSIKNNDHLNKYMSYGNSVLYALAPKSQSI